MASQPNKSAPSAPSDVPVKHVKTDKINFIKKGYILDLQAQELNGPRDIKLQGDVAGEVSTSFAKNEEVIIPVEIGQKAVKLSHLADEVKDEINKAEDEIQEHVQDTNNPHNVTAEQIGAVSEEALEEVDERVRNIENTRLLISNDDHHHRIVFSRGSLY